MRRLAMIAGVLVLPGCGGPPSKLEFHADGPGNFRVLVAGKPDRSKRTLATPAGPLELTSMESVDGDRIRRIVAYADLPPAAGGPDALLDGGVRKMTGDSRWTVQGQVPIALDGHPGREVRFAVGSPPAPEKGAGRARIFLVGNRLYQAIMVGPASKVTDEELDHFVKSFELLKRVPAVAAGPLIAAARPPAVVREKPVPAPAPEPAPAPPPDPAPAPAERPAVAPPDPAPEPVVVEEEPPDRAERPAPARPPARRPSRKRAPVMDPAGDEGLEAGDDGAGSFRPARVPIEITKAGGFVSAIPEPNGNPREQFREVAPQRGVLVGLRVGYVNAFGGPKVGMIEPIFQAGKRYIPGRRYGGPIPPMVTVVAKPGYAVGAIYTRTGLLVDAFQVEFMRFRGDRLDPNDSYTTNWLGDSRGGGPRDAPGQGRLVVGIHGRTNGREINALGLLVVE